MDTDLYNIIQSNLASKGIESLSNKTSSTVLLHEHIPYTSYYFNNNQREESGSYIKVIDDYQNERIITNDTALDLINNYFSCLDPVKNLNRDTGILPPGVKMIGDNYVVYEKPPTFKNVFYYNAERDSVVDTPESMSNNLTIARIPIPWQLYIAKFNQAYYVYEVSMFFMNTSLLSVDQPLYLPPLPNFYTNATLCPPIMDNMEDVDRYSKDVSGIIASSYDWVWNSGSNHDLTEACLHVARQLKKDESILRNMPDDTYTKYFNGFSVSRYAANVSQVTLMLKAWEEFSLQDVCEMKWPNTSGEYKNFRSDHSSVTEHSNFYDHLEQYLIEHGNDAEDIHYIIEEGDYDGDDYLQWVVGNNLISVEKPWLTTYTYQTILNIIIRQITAELRINLTNYKKDVYSLVNFS